MISKFKNTIKLCLFFITLSLLSCNDSTSKLPAYLFIDNVEIETNIFSQGAPTHNISDIWVYSNGNPIGVFNTGELIPILSDDYSNTEISLFAGIRENGIKQSIQIYFLYSEIDINQELIPGSIDTIQPVFKYVDHAKFVFIENFENSNIFNKDLDGNSQTSITISDNNPLTGNYSGEIILTKDNPNIDVTSSAYFNNLPNNGELVYVELDYKCNTEFRFGLIGKDNSTGQEYPYSIIYIKQKEDWNKIYINLTKIIQDSDLDAYKCFFSAIHNEEIDTSKIYLDNVKLLYSEK